MSMSGYECKTPECKAYLKAGDIPKDSPRAVHVPIPLGPDPVRLKCPVCLQTHEYSVSQLLMFHDGPKGLVDRRSAKTRWLRGVRPCFL